MQEKMSTDDAGFLDDIFRSDLQLDLSEPDSDLTIC